MRAIRSKATSMEIALAKALWARGLRYRKMTDLFSARWI